MDVVNSLIRRRRSYILAVAVIANCSCISNPVVFSIGMIIVTMAGEALQGIGNTIINKTLGDGICAVMTGCAGTSAVSRSIMHDLNGVLGAVKQCMADSTVRSLTDNMAAREIMGVMTGRALKHIGNTIGNITQCGRIIAAMTGGTGTSTVSCSIMHCLNATFLAVQIFMTGSTAGTLTNIVVAREIMGVMAGRALKCIGNAIGNITQCGRIIAAMTGGAGTGAVSCSIMHCLYAAFLAV